MADKLRQILVAWGIPDAAAGYLAGAATILGIALTFALVYWAARKLAGRVAVMMAARMKGKWIRAIGKSLALERAALAIPALLLYALAPVYPQAEAWLQRIALCLVAFCAVRTADKLLDAAGEVYAGYDVSRTRPIRGYLQVVKIIAYAVGLIVMVGLIIDRSPLILLGGIGAATAVLLLIFQNTILGFVASVQLTQNDMLRLGDWIEMPSREADGEVTEITLYTVKVQNWDKTVTTIPTYSLVTESFKNWRSMQEAGGRRIKRAIYIDISSIRFLDEETLERYRKIQYIREYLDDKLKDIQQYNQDHQIDLSSAVNGRHLTNIGTFRAYVDAYLNHHPRINAAMTRMTRQLEPTEHGLPLEIYAFAGVTDWAAYERIQSDIFDHIFAIVPEFGLRLFQSPSGYDLGRARRGE